MVWLRVRRWVVRPIFWALALVALAALGLHAYLSSSAVRVRLARAAEREASRVVGRPVTIGSLDFGLLPTRLVLRDVVVPGDRPDEPPFLRAREAIVDVDSDALRDDIVDLRTVSLKGLRVRVALRPDGTDNLPDFPPAKGGKGRFTVRIGGLYVEDGEVELEDRRLPLELSARAVMLRLAGVGGTDLQGNLTAQEVETRLPGARPWPATVSGKVRIESGRVVILSARLASAHLQARASGSVGWRGGTHGEIRAEALADGAWLDELGWLDGEIEGDYRFDGGVRFARRDLRIEGRLTSPRAGLFGFAVDDFAARVEGDDRQIDLVDLEGLYRGAPLAGRLRVDLAGAEERGFLEIAAEALPVRELLADLDLPDFRVAAIAHGELVFDFPFSGALQKGVGSAALELTRAAPRGGEAPLAGVVTVEIDRGRVAVRELALRSEAQRIDGSGAFDLDSGAGTFDVRIATADLDETARLQPFVALEPPPLWLPRSGTGELRAAVRLARGGAEARLDFELADLRAPGLVADTARGGLVVGEAAARDVDVVLTRADSRLRVSGVLPFEGTGRAAPVAALTVAFESWPVEEAGPWFPLPVSIAGPADGTLTLTGRPPDYGGELLAAVSPAAVAGLGFEHLDVALAWNESELVLRRAALRSYAGEVTGEGSYRFADEALDLRFASGAAGLELAAQPFSGLWGDRVTGKLALTGAIRGTMERPEGELDGTIAGFALRGRDLAPEGEPRIRARLGDGRLDADVWLPGLLEVHGGGPFVPGRSAALELTLASERLDRWAELAAGAALPGFSGAIGARLSLSQSAGRPLAGELVADRLDLAHRGRSVALIEPARVALVGGVARIATLYLGGADGRDELFVAGSVPLAADGSLDLKVQAALSVDWLEELVGLDLDGRVELLSTVGGSLESPEWNGEAALRDARLIPPRLPHTMERLGALVLLYPDALVLDEARGEIGGGRVTAFGRLDLPREGRPLDYRFQTSIRDTTIRYPAGFLLRGGGDLTLQSTAEGRQIRGEIDLVRVDYLQDIDLSPTQIIQRFLTRTRLQVDETDDVLSSTYLSVAVEGPGALRIRNNIARLDGSLDLTVRGTLASPVLFGEVVTVPGGTFEYGGNTYEVERGVLTFVNPSRIVPVVDLVTTTRIDDYDVQLTVGGSLDRLATNFSSNPPLPEYDVLALLATGSTSGDDTFSGSGGDVASGAQAAESLLYGQAAALIGSRVGTLFGVDRLRIDPLTTGDTVSAARVTVGKRLSRKVYVTYSVDPSSTAQQILEVEWRISDELMLVLTQNGDGSYALDTRWGRRF